MLDKYKYILWDFDGVIINSDSARILGFKSVLQDFPKEQVEKLLGFHHQNGGLSRYIKFRYFYEEIRGEKVQDEHILYLANEFSTIMKEILAEPNLLINDSVSYIQNNFAKTQMHIVSGSDGNELNFLCKKLGICDYFESISGSPISKIDLVKDLIDREIIDNRNTCLIGDSVNDYDAAKENNIDFWGYNNINIKNLGCGYIYRFDSFEKSENLN
jgi:phosphoglycolate phosphatase-like HAD superfamily hydrolase